MKYPQYKFINLPFMWIGLTLIYILVMFFSSFIASIIGLFVPIGLFNLLSALFPIGFITIPLTLIVVFLGEWILRKFPLSKIKKFLLIMLILFILTIIIDFIIYNEWQSLIFLLDKGEIHLNGSL